MPINACLIIPCFNEAARLDFDRLAKRPSGVTCLLVDDGSSDGTGDLARGYESATLRVLSLPTNVGKAEAVRQGVLYAQSAGLFDGVEWFGYWDADLATPLTELENFISFAASEKGQVDGILGSRIYRLGSTIVRSFGRHLAGRVFATLAAVFLRLDCYDSQCGAKLFRTDLAGVAFGEPFVSRWIFDLEVLVRLRDRRLIEYPLRQWADVPGGKVDVFRLAVPTLSDLFRIRYRYGRR